MKHALIIAVEKYQDSKISSVRFAENDATELSDALNLHGFEPENKEVLLSKCATKTRIESAFRIKLRALDSNDELFIFYAGHGFSSAGDNYITCTDTVYSDIIQTSISMKTMFESIRMSKCKKVVLFFDSCHSGLDIDENMRDIFSSMTDDQFKTFCEESEYHIAFAACAADEVAYSLDGIRHGVWTYHIIEAFKGKDNRALERGKYITARSLQTYLAEEVKNSIKQKYGGKIVQTPRFFGSLTREAVLAEFKSKDIENINDRGKALKIRLGDKKILYYIILASFIGFIILVVVLGLTIQQRVIRYSSFLNDMLNDRIEMTSSNANQINPSSITVHITSILNLKLLWEIGGIDSISYGHKDYVKSLAFSPDNKYLVSGDNSGQIKIWELNNWNNIRTIPHFVDLSSDEINSIAFLPTTKMRIIATANILDLGIWDIDNGKLWKRIEGKMPEQDGPGHSGKIYSVAFSPSGNIIASASYDTTIKLWRYGDFKLIKTLMGHTDSVVSAIFYKSDDILISASSDKSIKIWDIKKGKIIKTLNNEAEVHSIAIMKEPNMLISSDNYSIKKWDLNDGKIKEEIKVENGENMLSITPNGKKLISYGSKIITYTLPEMIEEGSTTTIKNGIQSLAISANGNYMAMGGCSDFVGGREGCAIGEIRIYEINY